MVLAPLARSLAPGGRMLTTYSIGDDPALELVRKLWPDKGRFKPTGTVIKELKAQLSGTAGPYLDALDDSRSKFRYHMHSLPSDMSGGGGIDAIGASMERRGIRHWKTNDYSPHGIW